MTDDELLLQLNEAVLAGRIRFELYFQNEEASLFRVVSVDTRRYFTGTARPMSYWVDPKLSGGN